MPFRSKYHAKKAVYAGENYDSRAEASTARLRRSATEAKGEDAACR